MKTVILAAGFGSRLWPLSTSEKPKQFQPLIGGKSPLSYTYTEMLKIVSADELYVLSLEGMQELILTELPDLNPNKIILVPERRNTLPHTLWALSVITDSDSEPILFKSVDHFILNPEEFTTSLSESIKHYDIEKQPFSLLCTAYAKYDSNEGYCLVDNSGKILRFLEKPSESELLAAKGDSDIYRSPLVYIASKQAFLDVLDELETPWVDLAKQLIKANTAGRRDIFLKLPTLDISSAVFQLSHRLWVHEIKYEYIDVGQFAEIYAMNEKDNQGNVIRGNVVVGTECHNCLIINNCSPPLVVMSLTDTVVVQAESGSLVSPFKDVSKIGDIYKTKINKT